MTIYVRVLRNGAYASLSILELTDDELRAVFEDRQADELRRWCVQLARVGAYWWQRTGYADDDGNEPEGT